MRDAVAAQPRRRCRCRCAGAPRRPVDRRVPASIARTGANVSPVIQPAQISSHSACLSCSAVGIAVGELTEEVGAAAAERGHDRAMGVGELDLGRRGQRQRRGLGGVERDPAVDQPPIWPAPDQVTSPDASSSSSIAGW